MPGARILGTGRAVPSAVLRNADLEARFDVTDDWIVARSGIRARHVVDGSGLATSDLAVEAARAALAEARVPPEAIDIVIVATASPDHPVPATACLVQARLGARRAAAFDLHAACSGFVYGLVLADRLLAAPPHASVLLIGADALSRHVDPADRNTSILFGDGAGAVVLGRGAGLLGQHLGADGTAASHLMIAAGGTRRPIDAEALRTRAHTLAMNGREVFRAAVQSMSEALRAAFADAGIAPDAVRWVIAHQANHRILRGVAEHTRLDPTRFWSNLERYGNTGAATIPLALAEAHASGALRPGDLVALAAAGAGFTWGAAVLRWEGIA